MTTKEEGLALIATLPECGLKDLSIGEIAIFYNQHPGRVESKAGSSAEVKHMLSGNTYTLHFKDVGKVRKCTEDQWAKILEIHNRAQEEKKT